MSTPDPARPTGRRSALVTAAVVTAAAATAVTFTAVGAARFAVDAQAATNGRWWVLLTWPFAHLTVGHLLFTGGATAAAAVIYSRSHGVIAAVTVAAASWAAATIAILTTGSGPVAGSSGLAAGFAAALAVLGPRRAIAAVAVVWLAATAFTPGVSAAAHLAGLAAGAAAATASRCCSGVRHLRRP